MTDICCAVFDADGTLLDSMRMWDSLDEEFLTRRGIPFDPEISRELHAMYFEECPEYFRRKFGIQGTDEEILNEFTEMAAAHYKNDVGEKPGAKALLQAMHAAGIRMCVATASGKNAVECALERLGLLPYIEFVMTCSEAGVGKEKPTLFDLCAARLGGTRQNTVVFEDALYALRTAAQAGYRTVAVDEASVPEADKQELKRLAGRYVTRLDELLK
ncbi:MAG: HAD family phosphatase [Clostridia bacterium]|nr:HAD family phosphatase [Clostridia bacterium]